MFPTGQSREHMKMILDGRFEAYGHKKAPKPTGDIFSYAERTSAQNPTAIAGFCGVLVALACCLFSVVAFAVPGDVDASWNGSGQTITAIGSGDADANGLASAPDGRVYQVGLCRDGADYHFCVIRYTADGKLDPSWNGAGQLISPIGLGRSYAMAIALAPSGSAFVAGSCQLGSEWHYCVAKYSPSGEFDESWNGSGYVITTIGPKSSHPRAIALQADGKVLVTGACRVNVVDDYCTIRYMPDGTLDPT